MSNKYPSKSYLWLCQLRACFYCRNYCDMPRLTWDHFIPRSALGHGLTWHRKRWNLVLACKHCNQNKRDRMPTESERERFEFLLMRKPPTLEGLQQSANDDDGWRTWKVAQSS